jgi:hypothetical protein
VSSSEKEKEEEEGAAGSVSEDGNDNTCHARGETGELLECDSCPRSWHFDCLPLAAISAAKADPWECPVCAHMPIPVEFIANPARAPPGRGGGQHQKRHLSAIEGPKSKRARVKAAGRSREVRWRADGS